MIVHNIKLQYVYPENFKLISLIVSEISSAQKRSYKLQNRPYIETRSDVIKISKTYNIQITFYHPFSSFCLKEIFFLCHYCYICFNKISSDKTIQIKTYENVDQKSIPNVRVYASSKKWRYSHKTQGTTSIYCLSLLKIS